MGDDEEYGGGGDGGGNEFDFLFQVFFAISIYDAF